jgi:preprotein translocase subunit SecY
MGVIDILSQIAKRLPVIKQPERPPSIQQRLVWTGVALLLFFLMYNITCFGVRPSTETSIDFLQTITASNIGSLLTAGIGPVVLASIFLQLFTGAGLINLDLKDKKDKQKFLEVQKIVAILLAIIEGAIFVFFAGQGLTIVSGLLGLSMQAIQVLVVIQIALGSVVVLYLDDLMNKYGIGSGIGLFIAAGVSFAIISGLVGIIFGSTGVIHDLTTEGALGIPLAIMELLPFIFMILVFLVVVYFEGVKVEIPIAFERVRGMVPKLPLKFFYVSNIPVIFAAALLMNLQIFGGGIFGSIDLPFLGYVENGQLRDGALYFITPIYQPGGTMGMWEFITVQTTPYYDIPQWVHAITYILFLSLVSILFGLFWVETSNMDAKSVAGQLSDSGLQIPGFRRDPRMLEMILNKHIFPLTVLGSFSVGLLAGIADLTGALGTGTGILLTVGILYRMYEQLEQMQAFEMYPALGELVK